MRTNVTLYLNEIEFRSLQKLAGDRGFVQTTGYGAGEGPNVSAMVRAIAAGRCVVVGPTPVAEEVRDALDQALKFFRTGITHDVLLLLRAAFAESLAEDAGGARRGPAAGATN